MIARARSVAARSWSCSILLTCFRYKFRIDVDDTVFKNLRLVGRYFELSGERAVAASVAIDLQGMIGEGHVGFARDELGCMFDSVCRT